MHYDPDRFEYWFRTYPWFVNDDFISHDYTSIDGRLNRLLIDTHTKREEDNFSHKEELYEELEKSPEKFFYYLDACLYQGYNEYKKIMNERRVYKQAAMLRKPSYDIQQAGMEIYKRIEKNISKINEDDALDLWTYAHHVAQLLMHNQKLFLRKRNPWRCN